MIDCAQIRAARSLLRWSARDLADKSGLGIATIWRAEAEDGIPSMRVYTLMKLQSAIEDAGVEFMDGPYTGDGGPGVRLSKVSPT